MKLKISKNNHNIHPDHILVALIAVAILAVIFSIIFVLTTSTKAITLRTDISIPASRSSFEFISAPLTFERNEGQFKKGIDAVVRGKDANITFASAGFVNGNFKQTLVGAVKSARPSFLEKVAPTTNYFFGRAGEQWKTGVENFGAIKYEEIYPGIDIVYRAGTGVLQYQFELEPGADPNKINVKLKGVSSMRVLPGAITGKIKDKYFSIDKLRAYQIFDDGTRDVEAAFKNLGNNQYGFSLGAYDKNKPLIIDPEFIAVSFSTYWGGSLEEGALGHGNITLDSDGNIYVVSNTLSTNMPTLNPYQASPAGGREIAIAKFSNSGSLITSTYLGGTGDDTGHAILIANGSVYVSGYTESTDFPVLNAYQSAYSGTRDSFISRFNMSISSLVSSTFFGGNGNEFTFSMTTDGDGNIYPCLSTTATDMPTVAAFQSTNGGGIDNYLAKFNGAVTSLSIGTYFGGSNTDSNCRIAVDEGGQIYLAATTLSTNFPTLNAYQSTYGGGSSDATLTTLSSTGSLVYSTYLGGTGSDSASKVIVDVSRPIVSGFGTSPNFPVLNAYQSTNAGGNDGFITKFNTNGSALEFSTYLGGTGTDSTIQISLDADKNIYFTGYTNSTNFPMMNALQASKAGGYDNVFGMMSPNADRLRYSTYFGGSLDEAGAKIALDAANNIFALGYTKSADFPVTSGAFQTTYGGGVADMYLAKIQFVGPMGGGGEPAPRVAITAPRGFENFKSGETVDVTWILQSVESVARYANLALTLDGGKNYAVFAERLPINQAYKWIVPVIEKAQPAKMRIEVIDASGKAILNDESDYFFDIKP